MSQIFLTTTFLLISSVVYLVACNSLLVPAQPDDEDIFNYWMERHERHMQTTETNVDNHIVWVGDSIIEFMEKSTLWQEKIAKLNALNYGIGWDRVEWLLWQIENGEFDFKIPMFAVVIFVGTNNHEDNTAEEIYAGIVNLVNITKSKLGDDVAVVLPTLLPRGEFPNPDRDLLNTVNVLLLRKFANSASDKIYVVRIDENVVQDDGTISAEDMDDFLHPTDSGYTKIFTPVYDKLLDILTDP